ncbi:MAG: hypothetical protein JXQ75_13160 [Phycisphaerae bacterium]|nr:hypothetical protein [Phycisphaerae bacterium]
MKAKGIITVVLLAFVGASLVYLVIQEPSSKPAVQGESGQTRATVPESKTPGAVEPTPAEPDEQTGHKLIAYYFHRTQRCRTCLTIEAYAEQTLEEAFPQALKTGELEWHTVNVEEPANEHFVEDYQLTSSELVLVETENGEQKEWRNLTRAWELVGDELKFKAYVEAEAAAFLEQDS